MGQHARVFLCACVWSCFHVYTLLGYIFLGPDTKLTPVGCVGRATPSGWIFFTGHITADSCVEVVPPATGRSPVKWRRWQRESPCFSSAAQVARGWG